MAQPAAKQGDQVTGACTHMIQPPGTSPPVATPGHPFNGILNAGLSGDVWIEGRQAAVADSVAQNTPPHIPQGGSFVNVAMVANRASISMGSATVHINGKQAARNGDQART